MIPDEDREIAHHYYHCKKKPDDFFEKRMKSVDDALSAESGITYLSHTMD